MYARYFLRRAPWCRYAFGVLLAALVAASAACTPTPEQNVVAYLIAKRLGTLESPSESGPGGSVQGMVHDGGKPIPGAAVIIAEQLGTPHVAYTDDEGRYMIDGVPPGQYVPAAVAPFYEETVPRDLLGIPYLVTVIEDATTTAPPIELVRHVPSPLPTPAEIPLELISSRVVTTTFPPGAAASVQAFRYQRNGEWIDTLRLYLPVDAEMGQRYPLLFMIYPTNADDWEPVSVSFASQGYAMVAVSPIGARGMDIDGHAQDARAALALAQSDRLTPNIDPENSVALGGSFSSAVLHRFLRDESDNIAAWVTVGGVTNAFTGADDFYAGRIELPPAYEYAIPALGHADLYPLPFLRYSPVYSAAQLPPTLIIHTDADRITPIDQAYQLEEALERAGVPVDVFYYDDVSHYLQIGADLTPEGAEMFYRVLDFARQYQ